MSLRFVSVVLLALMGLTTSCSEEEKPLDNAGQPKQKTEGVGEPERVLGTRVSIPRPKGFENAQGFYGYQYGQEAIIQVMDLEGGNFYASVEDYDKDNFINKGLEVVEYEEETTCAGYPARSVTIRSDGVFTSRQIVFGDSTFSTLIRARYKTEDKEMEERIKQALAQVEFDKDLKVDPFEVAPFELDLSESRLKFVRAAAGNFLFAMDGELEATPEAQPIFVLAPVPIDDNPPRELYERAKFDLQRNGFVEQEVIATSSDSVNGYPAYEVMSMGTIDGTPIGLYSLSLVHGKVGLRIQATTPAEQKEMLEEFRALAHTIRFK